MVTICKLIKTGNEQDAAEERLVGNGGKKSK